MKVTPILLSLVFLSLFSQDLTFGNQTQPEESTPAATDPGSLPPEEDAISLITAFKERYEEKRDLAEEGLDPENKFLGFITNLSRNIIEELNGDTHNRNEIVRLQRAFTEESDDLMKQLKAVPYARKLLALEQRVKEIFEETVNNGASRFFEQTRLRERYNIRKKDIRVIDRPLTGYDYASAVSYGDYFDFYLRVLGHEGNLGLAIEIAAGIENSIRTESSRDESNYRVNKPVSLYSTSRKSLIVYFPINAADNNRARVFHADERLENLILYRRDILDPNTLVGTYFYVDYNSLERYWPSYNPLNKYYWNPFSNKTRDALYYADIYLREFVGVFSSLKKHYPNIETACGYKIPSSVSATNFR